MGTVYNANKAKSWLKPRWRMKYAGPAGKEVDEKGAGTELATRTFMDMRERDVSKGCWSPLAAATGSGGMPTFAEYEMRHHARRVAQGKSLAVDGTEHGRMKNHVLKRIGKKRLDKCDRDVIRDLIRELMDEPQDIRLAPKSILEIYGDLRVLFTWAVEEKLVAVNPCSLKLMMDELPRKRDADPRWRETAKFARKELIMLLTDPRVPADRHMVYGLAFFGGMRIGEVAGRRWCDWDSMEEPLEKLVIVTQYDDEETKTKTPRAMPMLPPLAAMLTEFRDYWWPVIYGRKPTPDDFIVPVRPANGQPLTPRMADTAWQQLQLDLSRLGLRRRRNHDFRRTFISMARAGGAHKDALKACTHGDRGDVIDDYTTWPWASLCEAVSCVKFELPPATNPELRLVGLERRPPGRVQGTPEERARLAFIAEQPFNLSAKEMVSLGRTNGLKFNQQYVHMTRARMKKNPHKRFAPAASGSSDNTKPHGFSPTISSHRVLQNPGKPRDISYLSPGSIPVGVTHFLQRLQVVSSDPAHASEKGASGREEASVEQALLALRDALRSGAERLRNNTLDGPTESAGLALAVEQAARLIGQLAAQTETAGTEMVSA